MRYKREEIYLDLSRCSKKEINQVSLKIKSSGNTVLFPYLHFNDRYSRWEYFQCNAEPINWKTKITINQFYELFHSE